MRRLVWSCVIYDSAVHFCSSFVVVIDLYTKQAQHKPVEPGNGHCRDTPMMASQFSHESKLIIKTAVNRAVNNTFPFIGTFRAA